MSYGLSKLIHNNSLIFKTITNSVDESQKSIALFNKDWNTYKTNWQSVSGFNNKIGSIFSSGTSNKISSEQVSILRNWNNAVKHGCTNQATFNKIIANADDNTKLYFSGLNKGKASLDGLKNAQNVAKTSTIGLTVATTALNMAISFGIVAAISLAVKGIDKLVNAQENAIAKADEVISKFEEQRTSLQNNKSTIDEISSDYAKLSQGVDFLGRNISLNSEEYFKYNEIVNKIADMFPQMIQGYTEEGNAIIVHKGNVDELTKAYEEQKKAAQDAIIVGSADTFKGYKSKVNYDANVSWEEPGLIQQKNFIESLMEIIDDKNALAKFLDDTNAGVNEFNGVIRDAALENAGIKLGIHWDAEGTAKELQSYEQTLKSEINTITTEINTETAKIKPIMTAFMEQSYDYQVLDSDVQDVVSQIVGQFNSSFYSQFDNEIDMANWVTENIINKFKGVDGSKIADAFSYAIGLKTQLQNGDIPLDDYLKGVSEFKTLINGFDNNTKKSVDLIFNVTSTDGVSTDTLVNNVKGKLKDEFDGKVGELSLGDLEIAANLEVPDGVTMSWEELQQTIAAAKEEANETLTLSISGTIEQLNTQLKPAFEALKTSYQEIFTDDGFTLKNVDLGMLSNVQSVMKEMKEAGLGIDTSGFENLAKVLSDSSSTADEVQGAFDSLASSVLNSTDTIKNLDDSTADLVVSMLESLGVANAEEVVFDSLAAKTEALALGKQFAAQTGYELANATTDEVIAFLNHAGASETARLYLFQLVTAEQVFNAQGLDVTGKIEKLRELATAYGQTAVAAKIAYMQEQAEKSHTQFNPTAADLANIQKDISSAINNVKINFDGVGKAGAKAAGSAAKSTTDAWKEAYENERQLLDQKYDLELISAKEYYLSLNALNEKYFANRVGYEKDFATIQKEIYKGLLEARKEELEEQKSNMESAIDAIIRQYDKEIDRINDVKDASEETINAKIAAYDKQIDKIEQAKKALQNQIDDYQKEIDAINDANSARQRQYDLEQALYDQFKANNQKTIKQFNGTEIVYNTDKDAIRDADKSVADAKDAIEIARIQSLIDALEDQMTSYEDAIDKIKAKQDSLKENIESSNAAYESQIAEIERYKEAWNSVTTAMEDMKGDAFAESMLGEGWIEKVLSGDTEALENFRNSYIGVCGEIDNVQAEIQALMTQISSNFGTMVDGMSQAADKMSGSVEKMSNSLSGSGGGGASNKNTSSEEGKTDSANQGSGSGLTNSAKDASGALGEISTALNDLGELEKLTLLCSQIESLVIQLTELKSSVDNLDFTALDTAGTNIDIFVSSIVNLHTTMLTFSTDLQNICNQIQIALSSVDFNTFLGSSSSTTSTPQTGASENTDKGHSTSVSGIGGAGVSGAGGGEGLNGITSTFTSMVSTLSVQKDLLVTLLDEINISFNTQMAKINEYTLSWNTLVAQNAMNQTTMTSDMQVGAENENAILNTRIENIQAFSDSFNTLSATIQATATSVITAMNNMASAAEAAANRAVAAAARAKSASGGIGGVRKEEGTVGNAYAKGYSGLKTDEKNALYAEVDPELMIYPNGRYELMTEPTISDLPKGTVIFNGEQTNRILNGNNKPAFEGTLLTNETAINNDMAKKLNEMLLNTNPLIDMNLPKLNHNFITPIQQHSTPVIQNINLTLPNITNDGGYSRIVKELEHLQLDAIQYSFRK